MKVVIFIVILLGVIFTYSFIDEIAKGDGFSGSFGWNKKVENNSSAPKNYYYTAGTQSNTNTESPTPPNYIGKVKISRIRKASESNPSLITLSIRPYKGEPINLTNWTIKTRKGIFYIPQGMEYYQKNNPSYDIVIKESSSLYLVGDVEPLGTRKNFKTNKCFGYLSKSKDIYPRTSNYCQAPKLEKLEGFTPYCQDYLIHKRTCKMPDYSNDFKISTDSKCVSYILNYYTYNGCFNRYSKEDDFLSNKWYVYVNKNIVEELHDTIYLYDQNNLLIDKYIY